MPLTFRRRKHPIRCHYAGRRRFHQHAEHSHPRSGEAALRKRKRENEGNLLRAISHDLRTPLTSIYGSSSTLISKYDALPKEQQLKLLGEIQEDSEWLIRMVENLLSVTRIDGAKVKVVKTPTVLDELIDSVLMKFSKKHPNQKVITQIPEEFVDIPMDSLLIEQVLLNLLENAVFHAKGMTELTLSVSLVGDKAVFEVADNGCGIPDDALQKIFSGSYEKSAAPVDGTRSNMGIGLSVCAASSRRTTARLLRKIGRAAARYSALLWKEGVRTMGNNKYKILIVEDEANIRSFIKANLETSDYQVLCAETCELGMMMYAPIIRTHPFGSWSAGSRRYELDSRSSGDRHRAHHCAFRPFQREGQGGGVGSGRE